MKNTKQRGRESLQRGNALVRRADAEKMAIMLNVELSKQLKLLEQVGELTQKRCLSCTIQNCQNRQNYHETAKIVGNHWKNRERWRRSSAMASRDEAKTILVTQNP